MVTGEHTAIRTAEWDDAAALRRVYDSAHPKSVMLDRRREPLTPTLDEVRQSLTQKEVGRGLFYAVEDRTGQVRGFVTLRGMNAEVGSTDAALVFFDDSDFATPVACEALDFLKWLAFRRMRLAKVVVQSLDTERDMRDFLARNGFESAGVQREVLYTLGRWHDIETLVCFEASASTPAGGTQSE